jgi:hypothetical protein
MRAAGHGIPCELRIRDGDGRMFADPADFNVELQEWLDRVNIQLRRALGCARTDWICVGRGRDAHCRPRQWWRFLSDRW